MAPPSSKNQPSVYEKNHEFAFFLEEGMRYIQELAGKTWTDHNASDPGITILEQLCYALADLSYRTSFDIPDLLAEDGKDTFGYLYSPRTILSSRPVTLNDLRALLIDLPEVNNAWILPKKETEYTLLKSSGLVENWHIDGPPSENKQEVGLKGLYRVQVETSGVDLNEEEQENLRSKIFKLLHINRNLGEDFRKEDIELLPFEKVEIAATIEIQPGSVPEETLATILHQLRRHISPRLQFYRLRELLDKGKRLEDIFEGPLLRHGFIEKHELKGFTKRTHVRSSDLVQEIMDIPGVRAVTRIHLKIEGSSDLPAPWEISLDPGKAPILKLPKDLIDPAEPLPIKLTTNGLPVGADRTKVVRVLYDLEGSQASLPATGELDLTSPPSRDRKVSHYHSIQHHFPDTYGVNETGLPGSAPSRRHGQARQLKAYLLFFDQILANAFAQLAHAKNLLGYEDGPSYATQSVLDPGDQEDTLRLRPLLSKKPEGHLAVLQKLAESNNRRLTRKNRFLDHLLARFNEEFQTYALLLFELMGDQWEEAAAHLIQDKIRFLKDYPAISAHRSGGFDQTAPAADLTNISFFKKRICRLLGFALDQRVRISPIIYREYCDLNENELPIPRWEIRKISPPTILLNDYIIQGPDPGGQVKAQKIKELLDSLPSLQSTKENFHLIEHSLLRPIPGKTDSWVKMYTQDPFSLKITLVFPDWAGLLNEEDFRSLVEQIIDRERPAHLVFRLLWLDAARMGEFEARQIEWHQKLEKYHNTNGQAHHELRTARNRLIDCLGIGISYPLPDLPVYSASNTYYQEEQPVLYIESSEKDVWYFLELKDRADEDWKKTDVRRRSEGGQLALIAPPIYQDVEVFYRVEARKYIKGQTLQRWLENEVHIHVGINTNLDIHFGEGAHDITINYNSNPIAVLSDSQNSIAYQLFEDEACQTAISALHHGNGSNLVIPLFPGMDPNSGFLEDIKSIFVKALKDANLDGEPDDLEQVQVISTDLKVFVRPDPTISFTPEYQIVDFQGNAAFEVPAPEAGTTYKIGAFLLPFEAFSFKEPAEDHVIVLNEEEDKIYIQSGFAFGGTFLEVAPLQVEKLKEDSLIYLEGYKPNGATQIMDQKSVVLVRPRPTVTIQWPAEAVQAGESVDIILTDTQKGVHYQLSRKEGEDLLPVGDPGFHYEDRAIETMRTEIDLLLDHESAEELILPTGILETPGSYTFHIFAIKTRTGVRQELEGSPGVIEVVE